MRDWLSRLEGNCGAGAGDAGGRGSQGDVDYRVARSADSCFDLLRGRAHCGCAGHRYDLHAKLEIETEAGTYIRHSKKDKVSEHVDWISRFKMGSSR